MRKPRKNLIVLAALLAVGLLGLLTAPRAIRAIEERSFPLKYERTVEQYAAEYQVDRLARTTGKSASEIRDIIKQCTEQPQFGFLGDARVNVLKVNLMLDGVL